MIAVASTITPPVAIAAYAAASISGGKPIATAVSASRIGIMIFVIPFAFAYEPLLLTVSQAGADFTWSRYLMLVLQLTLSIYVLASALIRFDRVKLSWFQVVIRIAGCVLMFSGQANLEILGIALAILAIAVTNFSSKKLYRT
jgi:TRAP-type uncharacterized transport system fused permease subunit